MNVEGKGRAFLHKWLHRFNQKWVPADKPVEMLPEMEEKRDPVSLRIAAVFNWLNFPLFWLGIGVVVWLVVEYLLQLVLEPSGYALVRKYSGPFLNIAAPAGVGYWTNWLAIKMLFYPKRNNAVWWGLIPARKDELVELMAHNILQRLISPEIIREYLREKRVIKKLMVRTGRALQETVSEPEFRADIKEVVANFLTAVFTNPQLQAKIYRVIDEKISQWAQTSLKGRLLDWTRTMWEPMLLKSLPQLPQLINGVLEEMDGVLDQVPDRLKQQNPDLEAQLIEIVIQFIRNIDLKQVIKQQFQKMNTDEFERMISGSVQTELVFIQTSGGIFGALVGLAIVYPVLRLILLVVGLGLWVTYRVSLKYYA